MNDRLWTMSNALSFVRILLLPLIVYYLLDDSPMADLYAVAVIVVASLTDLFDGMLARKLNQVTELGKIIDPLADKICVGVVVAVLTYRGSIPLWFTAGVLSRDVLIFAGGLYARRRYGVVLMSNMLGKWAVTVTTLFVILVLIDNRVLELPLNILLVVSSVMMVLSFVMYGIRFRKILRSGQNSAS